MENNNLILGFSPCPNDTFMFDAMVHGKIDTEGLRFEVVMEDVEALNQRAIRGELDVTKISFAAFAKVTDKYLLLNSGSALGEGVGPLLIANTDMPEFKVQCSRLKVAIPGANTTANFLFSIFFPEARNIMTMIFSQIEDAVLSGKADAGVIIHENRFTYEKKGLKKVCDLGELWENEAGQPIPLGGIAVSAKLPEEVQHKLNRVMRRSVQYAFANPASSFEFVRQYALEMDEEVRRRHISLYVNEYSIDLGEKGRAAVEVFFEKAKQSGVIKIIPKKIFVSPLQELLNK